MEDVWFLKRVDWLSELVEEEWRELRARAVQRRFAAGETVFAPTPDPRSVYLLESGRVRIYRLSKAGDEFTLGFVAPGEVFGELAGFGEYRRESYAEAQQPSAVWKIPAALFRGWIRTRPNLVVEITRQMGERMKRVESRVESLVFRNVRSRLARVLLELAEDFGKRDGGAWRLDLGLSQEEIATLIGSSRQSVSATMARFKEEGLVHQQGRRLELRDEARLRELAEVRSA